MRKKRQIWCVFCMLVVVSCGQFSGCAQAPVQEMADARQAIQTAKSAGASMSAADRLVLAERLLQQAQVALEKGNYRIAKEDALAAKEEAIKARQFAKSLKGN